MLATVDSDVGVAVDARLELECVSPSATAESYCSGSATNAFSLSSGSKTPRVSSVEVFATTWDCNGDGAGVELYIDHGLGLAVAGLALPGDPQMPTCDDDDRVTALVLDTEFANDKAAAGADVGGDVADVDVFAIGPVCTLLPEPAMTPNSSTSLVPPLLELVPRDANPRRLSSLLPSCASDIVTDAAEPKSTRPRPLLNSSLAHRTYISFSYSDASGLGK